MSSRPVIRRTYGKPQPANTSSSSSLFLDSPSATFSSSPPPSDPILTPRGSSPKRLRYDEELENRGEPSSPFLRARLSSPSPNDENLFGEMKPLTGSERGVVTVQSSIKGFFIPVARKKVLAERTTIPPTASAPSTAQVSEVDAVIKKTSFIQLHLTHLPLLHTCKECSMSYVRGGEDEGLHAKHHIKVVRGMTWDGLGKGKGKRKEVGGGWRVVGEDVEYGRRDVKEKGKGRIIMCEGSWGGSKLEDILATVDTVLSSPPLPPVILDVCRIFLFLTASAPPSAKRQRPLPKRKEGLERIVGIVVSQPIKTAMRVLRPGEDNDIQVVDSGGGVVCDPEPLDTPLGIHRLFTIPSYRNFGLALHLLNAACRHTVYGCTFDPKKGEVAFSQPTESGRKAMERLGGGNVRVFMDDERQI